MNKKDGNKNSQKKRIYIIPNTHILVYSPKGICGSIAFNNCRRISPGILLSRNKITLSLLTDNFACDQCNRLIIESKTNNTISCPQKAALIYQHKSVDS